MKRLLLTSCVFAGLLALNLYTTLARAGEVNPVVLGLCHPDADNHNTEFQRYHRMIPVYREKGIRVALLEQAFFFDRDCPEDQLLAMMKKFHVIQLATLPEGVPTLDVPHKKRAVAVGRVLRRYVEEGGGLFLQPQPVRYQNTDDERYWNAVLAPLGVKILHEGDFDSTRSFEGRTLGKVTFWHTRNIQPHPITKDVSQLYLPLASFFNGPGIVAMQYGPEWQILVRGEKEAKSYRSTSENVLDLRAEGTYIEAPPVVAVRCLGKGRIACYPISSQFTGLNHRNPLWADIVECNGDRAAGQPSDSMKMQMNAYKWLAEPSHGRKDFGTYAMERYRPIQFPATNDLDHAAVMSGKFAANVSSGIRGIFGAHSAYSDGSGTVADYVKVAKAAGLSFLVFNDPLEKLTEEKLNRLKADCIEVSKRGDFYACPGVEFTDGIGNRWAAWSPKVNWPETSFREGPTTYLQWDRQRVHHWGKYIASCQYARSALLDYKQLRANGSHPENLWAFFDYLPFVYDKDRLIADNTSEYLFGLRDLRWASVAAFTRVRSPADVAAVATTCFAGIRDLPSLKAGYAAFGRSALYASQGPVIAAWDGISAMETNWQYTRGAQRARLRFVVRSDAGIAEVKVLDADHGPIRRFLGNGAKELARDFELVIDQQHYLVLEAIDTAGKKAISRNIWLYYYKGGLFRCGDNCNILGPTAMIWHPDRNQLFSAAKDFRNGRDYALRGWDTGSSGLGVPQPNANLCEGINIKEAGGTYPDPARLGTVAGCLMDVGVNSNNLQIVTMRTTKLSENYCTKTRPLPYMATVPRDVADLEYYEHTRTLYAPMERVDMFVTWNYRRDREGRKDYKGGILWHEGAIRFQKDCTLQGAVPIPLLRDVCPTDLSRNVGTIFVVTDANSIGRVDMIRDEKKPVHSKGRIHPGGYAALMSFCCGSGVSPVRRD